MYWRETFIQQDKSWHNPNHLHKISDTPTTLTSKRNMSHEFGFKYLVYIIMYYIIAECISNHVLLRLLYVCVYIYVSAVATPEWLVRLFL